MNCELTYNNPAYIFNVNKNKLSWQTGSRNLMGPKTLTMNLYEACDQISDSCHQ